MAKVKTKPVAPAQIGMEAATTLDGRDLTRGFVDRLKALAPEDRLLVGRLGGRYDRYEELLTDAQVASVFQQRRLALCSCEWKILPGADDARSQKAAAALAENLQQIDFIDALDKMLYGLFYGFAVAECLWGQGENRVVLEQLRVRKQRRFRFDGEGGLRLLTMDQPSDGEVMPDQKFWLYRVGGDHHDNPYGLGLAHTLYWPVFFKRGGIKSWATFLDKFGMPTAKGTFPLAATEEEKTRLLEALGRIQSDAGIILPEGMTVELIEASRGGSPDYASLVAIMDQAIAKAVLSQTMTTDSGSSLSQAEVHKEIAEAVTRSDGRIIGGSFDRTVGRWLTEWNFPGAAPPRLTFATEPDEDLSRRATRDKTLFDMGFDPDEAYVNDTYGGKWTKRAPSRPGPAFAESAARPPETTPDRYTDQAMRAALPILRELPGPARRLVQSAGSWSEVRDGIFDLYPKLDASAFADLMSKALLAAELAGRLEVTLGL